jgi:O-antigen/teichoic acid export membrane protein
VFTAWKRTIVRLLGHLPRTAVVASGHAISQLLVLAVAPVLSRLFAPEDFGVLASFSAIAAGIATLATFRFEQAVPLPRSNRTALTLIVLACITTAVVVACSWFAAQFFDGLFRQWFVDAPLPDDFALILAAVVIAMSAYQIAGAWMMRSARFVQLARMRIVYVVVTVATQIVLGISLSSDARSLILGQALGYSVAVAVVVWSLGKLGSVQQLLRVRQLRLVASRYRNYPCYDVWAALAGMFGILAPPVILAFAYDARVAGWFALAHRTLHTPLTMIGHSLSRVYYSDIARLGAKRHFDLRAQFRQTLRRLTLMLLPCVACAAIIAPLTFEWIFGSEWRQAGWCFALISPMISAFVVSNVIGPTLDVLGRQRLKLAREALTIVPVLSGILGARVLGLPPLAAVALMSMLGTVGYLGAIWITWAAVSSPCQHPRHLSEANARTVRHAA